MQTFRSQLSSNKVSFGTSKRSKWLVFIVLTLISLFAYTSIDEHPAPSKVASKTLLHSSNLNTITGESFHTRTSLPIASFFSDELPYLVADISPNQSIYEMINETSNDVRLNENVTNDDTEHLFPDTDKTIYKSNNLRQLNQHVNANAAQYIVSQANNSGAAGASGGGGAGGGSNTRNQPSLIDKEDLNQDNTDSENLSPATVPLPPAIWLFGTALLSLMGIKRKTRLNC